LSVVRCRVCLPMGQLPPNRKKASMAFDLSAYETVAERLQRALTDHPDLRIITEIVDIARDPQTQRPLQYVVRASVFVGDVLKAVDFAEEVVGSSHINKTSALENASTSATGRALSLMGYMGTDPNTKKPVRPTKQDMEKAERVKDVVAPATPAPKVTEAQYVEAETAIALADTATTLESLKSIYMQYSALKDIKVNGTTLLDTVNKRKREFA
jgi:hypothetical protein